MKTVNRNATFVMKLQEVFGTDRGYITKAAKSLELDYNKLLNVVHGRSTPTAAMYRKLGIEAPVNEKTDATRWCVRRWTIYGDQEAATAWTYYRVIPTEHSSMDDEEVALAALTAGLKFLAAQALADPSDELKKLNREISSASKAPSQSESGLAVGGDVEDDIDPLS